MQSPYFPHPNLLHFGGCKLYYIYSAFSNRRMLDGKKVSPDSCAGYRFGAYLGSFFCTHFSYNNSLND